MQYGFVIDHERCIGCHACTVACKAENDVPVGDFRTWVKYTEQGVFPEVKRHFSVLRCNHCTDAPCVTICPVKALEKRSDGIVDIDRDACIGCRACMQACPYDAIYLNADRGAVEKCHFCAHRVEMGLQPACVNVCPEEAIIPGDFDDPGSKVSLIVTNNETLVRRPEQKTGPNVHYVGVEPVTLQPGAAARPNDYLWSNRPPDKPEDWPLSLPLAQHATVVLDAGHKVEWGWPVALYLVTKGLGAGAALLAPFAAAFGMSGFGKAWAPEVIAILFTAITCGLLVEDLKRPMRFYRMLTRPNFDSWLVRGGIVLTAFGVLLVLALFMQWRGDEIAVDVIRWPTAIMSLAAAGYTAYLFKQCKGRDLWEGPLLLPHLIVQAALCGAVAFLPFAPDSIGLAVIAAAASLGHLGLALADRYGKHPTDNATQAAAFLGSIRLGPLKPWRDGLLIGVALTLVLLLVFPAAAFVPALVGLFLYEHAFVRAAQLPPLS